MSTLDKKYFIKLDTKNSKYNNEPQFYISECDTSDMLIRVTNKNKLINLENVIILMVAISPNSTPYADFLEVESAEEGLVYCNLKNQFKNITGLWNARLMLIYEDEKVVTGTFSYKVNTDEFIQLNEDAIVDDRFPVLTDLISRLSQIEIQENNRQEAEASRVEAEKQREIAKQQMISDIQKLISDTNLKVQSNLSEQNDKVSKLISDTEIKIDNYKTEKDLAIDQDLELYKTNTTQDIENYKNLKDTEIDQDLEKHKSTTTANIEAYKNSKNTEINQYKTEKDLAINNYISAKNTELENYKNTKNTEIDTYKTSKDTLINNKLKEVDTAEAIRIQAETLRQTQHTERQTFLNGFESRLINTETKNKVQDVYISGLFNENNDKRLTVEGTGNTLTLTGSKKGMVTVDKVVGDTMLNIAKITRFTSTLTETATHLGDFGTNKDYTLQKDKDYTFIVNVKNTSNGVAWLNLTGTIANIAFPTHALSTGINVLKLQIKSDYIITDSTYLGSIGVTDATVLGNVDISVILLEGDYTSKPIPITAFEGLKSTFEDGLVTQEMVAQGIEKAENLGKYKVAIKVRGRNLFDNILSLKPSGNTYNIKPPTIKNGIINVQGANVNPELPTSYFNGYVSIYFKNKLKIGFTYKISMSINIISNPNSVTTFNCMIDGLGQNTKALTFNNSSKRYETSITYRDIGSNSSLGSNFIEVRVAGCELNITDIQVEENSTSTLSYEPYYERTQAVYLTSPLLKGDEIVVKDDGLYHYHKMGKVVLNGSENWANETPMTNTMYFICTFKGVKQLSILNCDKFPCYTSSIYIQDIEGIYTDTDRIKIKINISKLSSSNVTGFKSWLQANPTTVVYELAEPYYEKIADYPITLEIPNTATLSVESVIPCKSLKATYTGSVPSVYALENSVENIESQNVDIVATTWDVDYRLCEVEWVLEDAGIVGVNLTSTFNLNMRGEKAMALTRYEQAKIMILGGAYEKETLTRQLTRYLEKGLVTQEEYDELIALMEAKDLVVGE